MRHTALTTMAVVLMVVASTPARPTAQDPGVSPQWLRRHVAILASDALEGRSPGTRGEDLSVRYIQGQFEGAGLCPGFHGRWRDPVPMLAVTPRRWRLVAADGSGRTRSPNAEDLVLTSGQRNSHASVRHSRLVFAGFGISAPDLGRDDYAGTDIRGRTVLLLTGVPGTPAFRSGEAAFRYGYVPNKVAEAARRGAEAVLVVVAAGDDWRRASEAARGRRVSSDPLAPLPRPAIEGRVTAASIDGLLGRPGRLAELENAAQAPDFQTIDLGVDVNAAVGSKVEHFVSSNVVGWLPGTERPAEHVIFTAHWDHLGRCPSDPGKDHICNGAVDNASGVASLIELARRFTQEGPRKRSMLFIATTGEESGFVGSSRYVAHPAFPLQDAVGGANLDMTAGRAKGADVVLFGRGLSQIDEVFSEAAKLQGRRIVSPRPAEAGYYTLSDGIVFIRAGVPLLTASGLWAEGPGREAFDEYESKRYHQPSDELGAIPSFEGAAEDVELNHLFGRALADSADWPEWRPGSGYSRRTATAPTSPVNKVRSTCR